MSYISDYKHGGDQEEYDICAAEDNYKDQVIRKEEDEDE